MPSEKTKERTASVTMDGEEVSRWVAENNTIDASALLQEKCPKAARKFLALIKKLDALRDEVAEVFPDANYYLAAGTMCLMLGLPQDDRDGAHQERIGAAALFEAADGGDW